MSATAADVIAGRALWSVEQTDVLTFLRSLPADSVSLVFTSPPYTLAREYRENGEPSGAARPTEEWVSWLVAVYRECLRVCTGLVAMVVEDQTRNYRYGCGPALLMADLHRSGVHLRKPCIYRRVGIPGSGGPDYLRSDFEWIVVAHRGGKLPWSDNTACGHPPKWAPGGEMSNRLSNGTRVNQWGRAGGGNHRQGSGARDKIGRPSHVFSEPEAGPVLPGLEGLVQEPTEANPWNQSGKPKGGRHDGGHLRSEEAATPHCARKRTGKARTSREPDGSMRQQGPYDPPVLANPGTVIQETYTAQDVRDILGEVSDICDCQVGGGQMGSPLAHENEAPFPETLAEFFIRSFCPPGGVCLDPFAGSGTTPAVALRLGRRAIACDLRDSQVQLARRRISGETPSLFGQEDSHARVDG